MLPLKGALPTPGTKMHAPQGPVLEQPALRQAYARTSLGLLLWSEEGDSDLLTLGSRMYPGVCNEVHCWCAESGAKCERMGV